MRASRRMTREYQDTVRAWVRRNLGRLKMSQAELSRLMGMKDASYIGHSMRGGRNFKAHEIDKMEDIFKEAAPKQFQVANVGKSGRSVTFGGRIALGVWRDYNMLQSGQKTEIPAIALPRYLDTPQEAWLVDDDSAGQYAPKGYYVIVVDYYTVRTTPQPGDKVIVMRYHPILFSQGDLSQAEYTIRLIDRKDGELVFKSVNAAIEMKEIEYNPDDKSVVIHKLIIGGQFYEQY